MGQEVVVPCVRAGTVAATLGPCGEMDGCTSETMVDCDLQHRCRTLSQWVLLDSTLNNTYTYF